jgi:hypothetical protein
VCIVKGLVTYHRSSGDLLQMVYQSIEKSPRFYMSHACTKDPFQKLYALLADGMITYRGWSAKQQKNPQYYAHHKQVLKIVSIWLKGANNFIPSCFLVPSLFSSVAVKSLATHLQ